MILPGFLGKLERVVSRCWRALLARTPPGFGVGKDLTLEANPIAPLSYVASAGFEARLSDDPRIAAILSQSRQRMRNGRAVQTLMDAASRSNALIGAYIVSGANRENHYLLAVIPPAWINRHSQSQPRRIS